MLHQAKPKSQCKVAAAPKAASPSSKWTVTSATKPSHLRAPKVTSARTDIDMTIQREEYSASVQDAQRRRWASELQTMEFNKSRRLVALRMLINEARNYQKSKSNTATTGGKNAKPRGFRGDTYYRNLHYDVKLLLGVDADHREHVQGEVSAQLLFR